jgi:hypothetical protein
MKVANMSEMVKKPGGTNERALCIVQLEGDVLLTFVRSQ